VGTVEGEDLSTLKDIERRPPVREDEGPWPFDDLSETDAISEAMDFGGTGGGLHAA
jgi:hypothetical protein